MTREGRFKWCRWVWGILWEAGSVRKFLKESGDIGGHGNIDVVVVVVPAEMEATELGP